MNYYYTDSNNQPVGPMTADQLHTLYQDGAITLETFVISEGATDWQAYRNIVPNSLTLVKPPAPPLPIIRQSHAPIALSPSTHNCPFCAEPIAAAAKKCKHCGETLDVTLRAAEEAKRAQTQQPTVYMNAGGASTPVVVAQKRDFPHLIHLFLSVCTAGAWILIWLLHYLFRSRSKYN